ncbi:MAG: hypothetical protein ACJ8M4_03490 [Chthoniobacterales bacterium]
MSAALALFCQTGEAGQVDVTHVGGSDYNNPANWSPQVVPNNGNGGNTYRVTIGDAPNTFGVESNTDVTVDALTVQNLGSLGVSNHLFTSGATDNDRSVVLLPLSPDAFLGGISVSSFLVDGKYAAANLGTLANYNPATQTLESGGYSLSSYNASYQAIISFNGARIVTNSAAIKIAGRGSKITDGFGANALQPLAVNNGLLIMGQSFATAGDFTNNGELRVIGQLSPDEALAVFNVTGRLTNFDPATRTLSGGTFYIGGPSNWGDFKFMFTGADVVTNSSTLNLIRGSGPANMVDEHGADALGNLANNTAAGNLTLNGHFSTTATHFTNAGYMRLDFGLTLGSQSTFVQSDGTLVVSQYGALGGKLDTQGGSIVLNGGMLVEAGTLIGNTTSNALISPGDTKLRYTPRMTFDGNLTLGSSSILLFDLAGNTRGPGAYFGRLPMQPPYGYDAIDCTQSVTVGGELQVSLSTQTANGIRFTPGSADTYVLVKGQTPIAGAFANVANGQRLKTRDGGGSFVVNYGPTSAFDPTGVTLSAFQPDNNPATLRNISTRGLVGSGQRVIIGGFIVTGSEPKQVIVRAIGPSLQSAGVAGVLDDPILTLYDKSGVAITSNDDWQQSEQRFTIQVAGLPPGDPRESAVAATLPAGSYTAVVEGKNGHTGVCLVEIYDWNNGTQSQLANISTRGYAEAGNNALIGGIIIGGGTGSTQILARALGPSLSSAGVSESLEDPILTLYNASGSVVSSNDDWQQSPERVAIEASDIPPRDPREAAVMATLTPGSYTALIGPARGKSGLGLVEFYRLK